MSIRRQKSRRNLAPTGVGKLTRQRRRPSQRYRPSRHRRLLAESLEDRRLLAVSFEFNYLGGNAIGFNDPVDGAELRTALETAATQIGNEILQDATIQMDVGSQVFAGTAIATAASQVGPATPGGGFLHRVIPSKIVGQGDTNGGLSDGRIDVFFFDESDPFTYVLDPAESDAAGEIDLQAVIRHELFHMIGFTSSTRIDGSDDSGNGLTTPGTWTPYDEYLSDVDGNRFIDPDPNSSTAFQMDQVSWLIHSVGGQGPNAGLFFDGPIATAVYGNRVPLYSPETFSLASSVSHLDSQGYPTGSYIFSPETHPMSHAIITGAAPQELTLLEKAIIADTGIAIREDQPPTVEVPQDIELEANRSGGFAGPSQAIDDFLAAASATDLFDPAPSLENDVVASLVLGDNVINFTATDRSGNVGQNTATIRVVDTIAPTFALPSSISIQANTPTGANLQHPDLRALLLAAASDVADSDLAITADLVFFPIGSSEVLFTVTDDSGNSTSASTQLTVTDEALVVTTLDDENDSDPASQPDDMSLREAIALANADSSYSVIRMEEGLTGAVLLDEQLGALVISESVGLFGLGADVNAIDGQSASRVVNIVGDDLDVLLSDFSISNGNLETINEGGAGIRYDGSGMLTIQRSQIFGNQTSGTSGVGAGIQLLSGELSVHESWIHENTTIGPFAGGGGIWARGPVTLVASTVSGNATHGIDSHGGGIHAFLTELVAMNSTISGNSTLASDGAGIYAAGSQIGLEFATITDNHASDEGGGIAVGSPLISKIELGHAIVAQNTDGGVAPDLAIGEIPRVSVDVDFSLIGDNLGSGLQESQVPDARTGNLIGASAGEGILNAELQALGDNGGPTPTHDLSDSSRAIDAGNPQFDSQAASPPLEFDQRGLGFSRVRSTVDIGAVEAIPALQVSWATPDDISYGTPLGSDQLNAVANVSGAWTYSPTFGTVLDVGQQQTLSATFTPDDLVNYSPSELSVSINVVAALPVITWNDPDPLVYGAPLSDVQLNATADVAGTFTYAPPEGVLLTAGPDRQLQVTFTPDSPNYQIVTRIVLIDILKATPDVTWNAPAPIVVGTELDATQLNAVASVSGSMAYTPDFGTILGVGDSQSLSMTFTPNDTANFNLVSAEVVIDVVAKQDFGDAPNRYPVLVADDGARHLPGGPILGVAIDIDDDGQPSAAADGDGADDDGIHFVSSVITFPSESTTASVQVTASGTGLLDAWIDFNADGDWDDAGEQIAQSYPVTSGSQLLSYLVPTDAAIGETAARFRLSTVGNLSPVGPAADGEVEDYLVEVLDGQVSPSLLVQLPIGAVDLSVDKNSLVIESGEVELSRTPLSELGAIAVRGGASDQTFAWNLWESLTVPLGGIQLDGDTDGNTLKLTGDGITLDLTLPLVDLMRFSTIDLTSTDANGILLDAGTVRQLAPLTQRVLLRMGAEDSTAFTDEEDWRMSDLVVVEGQSLLSARNVMSGESVVFDNGMQWQNPIEFGDVNNDGSVSAGDALRIINELSRRDYSDGETGQLLDPASLEFFPGVYFDHNGDGFATALDALRVINDVGRAANSAGEGELAVFGWKFATRATAGRANLIDHETSLVVSQSKLNLVGERGANEAMAVAGRQANALESRLADKEEKACQAVIEELLSKYSLLTDWNR